MKKTIIIENVDVDSLEDKKVLLDSLIGFFGMSDFTLPEEDKQLRDLLNMLERAKIK